MSFKNPTSSKLLGKPNYVNAVKPKTTQANKENSIQKVKQ